MQQRILIRHFPTFTAALNAKEKLAKENSDVNYKIRRVGQGFNLVRRFSVNEIKAAEIPNVKKQYRKQRRKPLGI